MRRLRSALLFALCALLPFAGSAGAFAFAAPSPCAVQHTAGADVTGHSAKSAGCCEQHRPADAGPSCKAGHDCTCAIPGLPQVSLAPLPPPASLRVAVHDLTLATDVQPVAVWRPPTSL
jgi:hypothetical protein